MTRQEGLFIMLLNGSWNYGVEWREARRGREGRIESEGGRREELTLGTRHP